MNRSVVFFLLLSLAVPVRGDDEAAVKAWLQVCDDYSRKFSFVPADMALGPIERGAQPIFRHAQPARGNDIGAVWIWTDSKGRPAVIGDTFTWSVNQPDRHITQEFHALTEVALEVRFDQRRCWSPAGGGLVWKEVPGATPPFEMKTARQREGRGLARRFSGHSIDGKSGRRELRVVPQPVFQYESAGEKDSRQGGAVFAFCEGTDPEAWLLLEVRRTTDGPRWFFACAPFTDYAVRIQFDEQDVWQADAYRSGRTDQPHWIETIDKGVLPRVAPPSDTGPAPAPSSSPPVSQP
jgi:hypothetical protein